MLQKGLKKNGLRVLNIGNENNERKSEMDFKQGRSHDLGL
jgi:hypothetical protein